MLTQMNQFFINHLAMGSVVQNSCLTSLVVNVQLKFEMFISEICQCFFVEKKCEKLLSFFQQKVSVYLVIKV